MLDIRFAFIKLTCYIIACFWSEYITIVLNPSNTSPNLQINSEEIKVTIDNT